MWLLRLCPCLRPEQVRVLQRALYHSGIAVTVIMFLLMNKMLAVFLSAFIIYDKPIRGNWYLAQDFRMHLESAEYASTAALAVVGIICHVVAFSACIFAFLRKYRTQLDEHNLQSFSFLFESYNTSERHYYEGVVLVRRLLISALAATLQSANAQMVSAAWVMCAFLALHAIKRPYKHMYMNYFAFYCLWSLFTLQMLSLFAANSPTFEGAAIVLCVLTIVSVLVWAVALAISLAKAKRFALSAGSPTQRDRKSVV